jgi:hypothetical protein
LKNFRKISEKSGILGNLYEKFRKLTEIFGHPGAGADQVSTRKVHPSPSLPAPRYGARRWRIPRHRQFPRATSVVLARSRAIAQKQQCVWSNQFQAIGPTTCAIRPDQAGAGTVFAYHAAIARTYHLPEFD